MWSLLGGGGGRYCDNFLDAIEIIREDAGTKDLFAGWINPWFMLENADDYSRIFNNAGFDVTFSEIETRKSKHTVDEAYNIFGAGINFYL